MFKNELVNLIIQLVLYVIIIIVFFYTHDTSYWVYAIAVTLFTLSALNDIRSINLRSHNRASF